MLKPTRLTDGKTTRCDLSTSVVGGLRRHFATPLSACCALFFLLHGVAFSGDDADAGARPSGPRPLTSASTTRQPSNARLTVPVKSQDLASELAQLEFRFREAQTIGSERLDELTPQIAELVDAARRLATQTAVGSDERLDERAQELILQLVEFQRLISASSVFFKQLAKLDVASLDAKETRSFFSAFSRHRDLFNYATPSNATFAAYQAEFARVASSLDALQTLESWNAFVETRGSALERFCVAPGDAEEGLAFISQIRYCQGLPKEFKILERRAAEWRFTSLNHVAIQRKILLALEAELTIKYWTFAATSDKIYYLPQPPRVGRNVCFADAQGARSFVDVPSAAPETATSEPSQRQFLQSLADEARLIPETLRVDDAARWYAAWSALFSRLQRTDALDPLVQFRLLHSIANTLSSGDFYFAQRLAPTLRMLNVPRLSDVDSFDVFQTENVATQDLRRLARSRIAFLPADRLTVDKTTEELDAQTERFSFVYRRVGWLDRDFSGAWRCRRPESAPLPIGELYVLLAESNDATDGNSATSESRLHDANSPKSTPQFRWLKIGSSDGRQITLKLATPNVCRGSIVLCRSRAGTPKPVANSGELERLIRR